ncbi:FAD-dependent oxidoreductase [Burkholderia perseverans]|uniref:FAD-dependent oxidoreductase n=1 Tax=Burkholderia perseverans TaxID=2615214 RepID=UPI001FEDACF2|nr:NAD(P)/FAD-dependent oxidoreductase [Burkholderia perseverans]
MSETTCQPAGAPTGPAVPALLRHRRIAIVGGGPAGLTLARLLQMQGADVTVYERDASRAARGQGGSLDLHEDSGQLALRRAGLIERFRAQARFEGQLSRIVDRHGIERAELRADHETRTRPEIDRGALRELLLDSLAPGTVVWDARLEQASPDPAGGWRLAFARRREAVGADLLFGCDGGGSRVRPLRTAVMPVYSGVTFVQAWLSDVDRRHPEIAARVGPGSLMALGDDRALMAQRNGNALIRVYAVLRVAEGWHARCGFDWNDAERARSALLDRFAGWSAALTELLARAEPGFEPWPLHHVPARQCWMPAAGVTLLGDAAHIMPPFTGRGVNLAMLDALELAHCLSAGRFDTLDAAISAYETAMLARMRGAIEETLAAQDLMIAPDAPAGIVARLQGNEP